MWKVKLMLSQPNLGEVGAELGKNLQPGLRPFRPSQREGKNNTRILQKKKYF